MKNVIRKLSVLFMTVILAVSFFGCSLFKEKTFTKEGMSITLTGQFVEKEYVTQTVCYVSSKMVVTALKEEFTMLAGLEGWSLTEYASRTIASNKLSCGSYAAKGYVYFVFEKEVSGKDYTYYAACYKSTDAFWLIQFGCETKNYEDLLDTMIKYAETVTFEAAAE